MDTTQTTTTAAKCTTCNGTGTIRAYMHIANGRCFVCAGAGSVAVSGRSSKGKASAVVWTRAEAIDTIARCLRTIDDDCGTYDNAAAADQIRAIAANPTVPRDVADRALAALARRMA